MSDNLQKSVSEWLASEGFPLEMKVAAEFRRAGFWVTQSDYYEDPVEGIQREIDVSARMQNEINAGLARITFIVECKVSRDKPWVLFTADTAVLAPPARVVQRTASAFGKQFLHRVANRTEIQDLPFFTLPVRPGYSLAQALRKPDARDLSYQVISGVSAATAAQAVEADEASSQALRNVIEIVFPVVLLDGRLFEAHLDEQAKVVLYEVESGTLVWRNRAAGASHSIIRIATLKSLQQVVADALVTATTLLAERKSAWFWVWSRQSGNLTRRWSGLRPAV